METEEIRDLSIAVLLGGLIGGLLVFFSQTLPHLGLNTNYVAVQIAAFGLLVGVLPIRSYFGSSPQGILVPAAVSVTGAVVFVALLASTADVWLKLIAGGSAVLGAISAYSAFSTPVVPDSVLHLATIGLGAWILSFGVVLLLGLMLGGATSILTWVVSVGIAIAFVILFDSIGEEMNTVPKIPRFP